MRKPGSHRAPSHTGITQSPAGVPEAWGTHECDLSLRTGLLRGSFSLAYYHLDSVLKTCLPHLAKSAPSALLDVPKARKTWLCAAAGPLEPQVSS